MKYLEENSLNEKELKNLKKKGFSLNEIKKYAKYKKEQEKRFYYYGYHYRNNNLDISIVKK